MSQDYTYIGRGRTLIKPYDGSSQFRDLGNGLSLSITPESTEINVPDRVNTGGGKWDSLDRIERVAVSMELTDIVDPDTLKDFLRGGTSAVSATTVSGEQHTAYAYREIVLDYIPDPDQALTVSDGSSPGPVVDTDYERTASGIKVLSGGGISDETTLTFGYTRLAATRVEAMTATQGEFVMVFEGLNEAQSGKQVHARVHRIKFSPGQLPLITDEFGRITINGEALVDSAITTSGLSKYFRADIVT